MSLLDENIIERTDKIVPMQGAKCAIYSWGLRVPVEIFEKRFNEWARNITIADWDINTLHDLFQHILCDIHRTKWIPGAIFCPLTFVFHDHYRSFEFSDYPQIHRTHDITCTVQFETYSDKFDIYGAAGKTYNEIQIWPLPLLVEPARECLYIKTEHEELGVHQAPFPYCI